MSSDANERTPLLRQPPARALDLDAKLKKWIAAAPLSRSTSGGKKEENEVQAILSVFGLPKIYHATKSDESRAGASSSSSGTKQAMLSEQVNFEGEIGAVQEAIQKGFYPKMNERGTSGSYFARAEDPSSPSSVKIMAVFKPRDEEPYGNLNPKRQFLRKYFWWAMGRPSLLPNFSYLSEVGASYLNDRLQLGIVPPTTLVSLSSPTFHYHYEDRIAFQREGKSLPKKVGSYQRFLHGFADMSDFLREHPWPSRSKDSTERDLQEERKSHKKARKESKARLRRCYVGFKYFILCRQPAEDLEEAAADGQEALADVEVEQQSRRQPAPEDFEWTPELMLSFRMELEKLVILDYLMRNTDRGLDNAMVKCAEDEGKTSKTMRIGAIDSSLSFPHEHPSGIRDYPFGWLWLPTDLIGQPFSTKIRDELLPILEDPLWWRDTVTGLRDIFQQDPFFKEKLFEKQMSVMKGQGWNIVQALQSPSEGPLELVARPKKLVRVESIEMISEELLRGQSQMSTVLIDPVIQKLALECDVSPSAIPMNISRSKNEDVPTAVERANPRSLPERLDFGNSQSPRAQGDSLGIEVVEELESAARRSSRPSLARAFTMGLTRSKSPAPGSLESHPEESMPSLDAAVATSRKNPTRRSEDSGHADLTTSRTSLPTSPPPMTRSRSSSVAGRLAARFQPKTPVQEPKQKFHVLFERLSTHTPQAILKGWY